MELEKNTNIIDLADQLNQLSEKHFLKTLHQFSSHQLAEIFPYLQFPRQSLVVERIKGSELRPLVDNLYSDDLIALIRKLPSRLAHKIFLSCDLQRSIELKMILSFDHDSCGSIMSIEIVKLLETDTCQVALEKIKTQESILETINDCFVVSSAGILLGSVDMKKILLSAPETPIAGVMNHGVVSVRADEPKHVASEMITKYDLWSLAVVDECHRILGIVTADDVLDLVSDKITSAIHSHSGVVDVGAGSYFETGVWQLFKSRIPWLLILMFSASISGEIISNHHQIAVQLPSLIFFIPMLMDTAGNAGSQSSASVIRAMALEKLSFRDGWKVLCKELLASLALGLCMLVTNLARIILTMPQIPVEIAMIVSLTVLFIVILANIVGSMLPLLAVMVKQDPSSMSGPMVTTVCDALSLITYFGLATIYLQVVK